MATAVIERPHDYYLRLLVQPPPVRVSSGSFWWEGDALCCNGPVRIAGRDLLAEIDELRAKVEGLEMELRERRG
jgi:hypothetical protein